MRSMLMAFIVIVAATSTATSETAEEKGLRIATEARDAGAGFGSFEVTGDMVLQDSSGDKSVRQFLAKALEAGKEDRTLLVFQKPRDMRGTALLTYSDASRDRQWVYFPSTKRVRRITGSTKTSSFAGSEFTYEDLTTPPLERFSYRWVRDESCPYAAGRNCFVIERTPKDRGSGYRLQVVWINMANYTIDRVDFFDRKNTRIKTLTVTGYKKYKGKYWRADQSLMTNHRTKKSTVMYWKNYDFDAKLRESDFTQRAMERIN